MMTPPERHVLLVDDDPEIRRLTEQLLTEAGFKVTVLAGAAGAVRHAASGRFDLVLLDVMMPGEDGFSVCRKIRAVSQIPIVMLTARAEEMDRVVGLEIGADDYIVKPFSPRELVARVEAQFRRREMDTAPPPRLELPNGISVDLSRLEVHRDGQVIQLTPREGDILDYLIRNRHRVVTRDDLLLDVWHYKSANVETRTVDIHIVGLRRKVEPNPAEPTLIQTVRGKGYRWFA